MREFGGNFALCPLFLVRFLQAVVLRSWSAKNLYCNVWLLTCISVATMRLTLCRRFSSAA